MSSAPELRQIPGRLGVRRTLIEKTRAGLPPSKGAP